LALLALVPMLVVPGVPTSRSRLSTGVPLRRVRDVRLPGSASRFDYQDIDPARRRLLIAHLGASQVDVVDLDQLNVVGVVDEVPDVHGVRAAPDLGSVYASATGADDLLAIDASTLDVLFRVPSGDFPDGLAYDPADARVFVSNKSAGTITAFDARSGQATTTISLGRETGNVAYDPVDGVVFAAVRPPDELVRVDATTGAVLARSRLRGCSGAHGVYLEERVGLAFVACERNARLAVVDLTTLHQQSLAEVGTAPDVLAYDNDLHRLYVAAESGVVTVFDVRASSLVGLGRAKLANHAHSVAVDEATHRVYFPLEDVGGHPVLRVLEPTGRR